MIALLLSAALLAGRGARAAAPTTVSSEVTFYGAKDNCPPGGDIAYPYLHDSAGGTGTFADPITFAGAALSIPVHSIIYVPFLQKYFILEDSCEECEQDWDQSKAYHVDLWMGPLEAYSAIIPCEDTLTQTADIIINPDGSEIVNTTALFDPSRAENDGCIVPTVACTDKGKLCGNDCQMDADLSCAYLANLFNLTEDRFEDLNCNHKFKIDCSQLVPAGTTVCMGGTCGD